MNMYFTGLGNDCDTKINPSSQFHYKRRKCGELNRLFIEKCTKWNLFYG